MSGDHFITGRPSGTTSESVTLLNPDTEKLQSRNEGSCRGSSSSSLMYMSVQRSRPKGGPKSKERVASRHSSFVQTPSRSASTR